VPSRGVAIEGVRIIYLDKLASIGTECSLEQTKKKYDRGGVLEVEAPVAHLEEKRGEKVTA